MSSSNVIGTGQVLSTIYEWKIENYLSYSNLANGQYVRSPEFYFEKKSWHLRLYPNGSDKKANKFVFFFIKRSKHQEPVEARYAISIFDNKKKRIAHFQTKELCIFDNKVPGRGFRRSSSIIKSNEITIMCEIFSEDIIINKTSLENSDVKANFKVQICKAFENYRNNVRFCDVKLVVEQQEIFAHKMVLAANSKVFDAMFNHEMRENKDCKVVIEDVKYEVFQELLRFVYTGESNLSKDIATGLLKASDKYELLSLKDLCEREICKNLSTNNVIESLHVADTYNAQCLKKEAIDFIVSHGPEMIDHPEFDSLKTFHSDLFKDVFRSVFAQLNKKPKLA